MFVIIGTGRSGTKWCADTLTEKGVPTGHESIFTPGGRKRIDALKGDSSWLALPWLENGADIGTGPVIHVVRDPRLCIRSMLRIGKFRDDYDTPWSKFARKYCSAAYRPRDPFLRACLFWVAWNARCQTVARETLRIEELTAKSLLQAVGYRGNKNRHTIERTRNHHQTSRYAYPELGWADLPDDVRSLAHAFGYQETDRV